MVVVAYASADTLPACLGALPVKRLHGVVVVDNASPDDSARVAAAVPGVRVVGQDNRGFGGGCNRGVAELPGAGLLLFLNPDAVVETSDLLSLVEYLDARPSCALVGPRLFRGDQALTSGGHMGTLRTELRTVVPTKLAGWFPDRRLPPGSEVTGPVGYVEGACFLVSAAALREVHGFDESFFLFFEEMDLARRLGARALTTDLLTSARAQHQSGVSRATLSDGGRIHLLRSTVLHLHRQAPWKAWAYVMIGRLSFAARGLGGLDRGLARSWSRTLREGLADSRLRMLCP